MKKILYISYDGMTDPLGQSQIIPYLQGLSRFGYSFTILSFEKKERFARLKEHIHGLLDPFNIKWVPLSFTTKPPIISKAYDMFRMKRTAAQLHAKEKFDMIHCRGYLSADVGLSLKLKTGVKFFFDMRGFWADEKKDAGSWNMNNRFYRGIYNYYKRKEKQYLKHADFIISLTEAGKKEMEKWPYFDPAIPVSVIPCCADMDHFKLVDTDQKKKSRELLGISPDSFVLSYLGSIGAWYMLDEMLDLFVQIREKYSNAIFLFITPSDSSLIKEKAKSRNIPLESLVIREASRQQVPIYAAASDIHVSFIKPVYSKLSSSPTKLGEVLSMGIPVICNSGVGDVEDIVQKTKSGIIIKNFSREAYRDAVDKIPGVINMEPLMIRNNAAEVYDLNRGLELYRNAYQKTIA